MANGFTYCWSDHKTAKVYVGVHLGNTDDGYVCSSKSMLKEYSDRPSDFTREILFEGDYDICASFEKALISGLFKQDKNTFYNRSNGKKILFDDEIKKKISDKQKGTKMPNGHLEKMLKAREGLTPHRKGVVLTDEIKRKISDSKKGCVGPNKGRIMPEEQKLKLKLAHLGKKHSEEHKKSVSLAVKEVWAKRKKQGA